MYKKIKTVFNPQTLEDLKVDILGTIYTIKFKNYSDDPDFKKENAAGFCDSMIKEISICKIESYPDYCAISELNRINTYKSIIKHELIHAFLYECGLNSESHSTGNDPWAMDEEIVDWLSIQIPKIYKIYKELGLE